MDWEKALDTTSNVLGVLAQIASAPGLSMIPYVNIAATAITALNAAVKAGRDIKPYVDAISGTFGDGKKIPTEAEVKALDDRISELEAEVQKPLPPPEEGEPD
jgi:hypothetical protein